MDFLSPFLKYLGENKQTVFLVLMMAAVLSLQSVQLHWERNKLDYDSTALGKVVTCALKKGLRLEGTTRGNTTLLMEVFQTMIDRATTLTPQCNTTLLMEGFQTMIDRSTTLTPQCCNLCASEVPDYWDEGAVEGGDLHPSTRRPAG
jgi:hypothetical protein